MWRGAGGSTHVYLAILESLLQIVIYGFVGDLADQGKIGNSDFLLLGRFEYGLLCEFGRWLPSSRRRLRSSSILFAPGAL